MPVKGTKDVSSAPSRSRVRKIAIDGRSEPELLHMVRGHYDSEPLMRLEGEIHFDAALSRAEVEAAALVYGRPMPPVGSSLYQVGYSASGHVDRRGVGDGG